MKLHADHTSVDEPGAALDGRNKSPIARRLMAAMLLATGLFTLGAALASASGNPDVQTSGSENFNANEAAFSGQWIFYKRSSAAPHGGYGYPGKICDNANNSYAVFVHAKTEGYSYGPKTYGAAKSGGCTSESLYVWDPAATYVSYGNTEVCVDRGSLLANVCANRPHQR